VNGFTEEKEAGLFSLVSRKKLFSRKIRIDSKGRILLPADIRKNFGLGADSEVTVVYSLFDDFLNVVFGQGSAKESTKACGAFSPGSSGYYISPETPGPDPDDRGEEYG